MTKKEFKPIITALEAAYDKFKISNDENKLNLWYEMLKDLSYQECETAIKKLISEFSFAPTIADIRKRIADVRTSEILSSEDAWLQVTKSISKYGMYNEKDALANMDENVRQTVESIGWINICMSDINSISVLRGQFRAFYEGKTNRQKQDALLPAGLRLETKEIKKLTSGNFEI